MTSPLKTLDTGVASIPTPRLVVFPTGMPGMAITDYAAGDSATAAHPDTFNPLTGTNPPSATPGAA